MADRRFVSGAVPQKSDRQQSNRSTERLEPDGPPAVQRHPVHPMKEVVVREPVMIGGIVLKSAHTVMRSDYSVAPLREPLVEPADWKDPDDTGSAARMRGARVVDGYRVAWQVAKLHKTSPREITEGHVLAAERFMNDWNVRTGTIRSQLGGGGGGGDTPIVNAAVRAGIAMDAVKAALGENGWHILIFVVINNRPYPELAKVKGIQKHRAFGQLTGALERLREHYQPPAKSRPLRAPCVAPDVDDVPAERLGRWRATPERNGTLAGGSGSLDCQGRVRAV